MLGGDALADALPPSHRDALLDAIDMLVDESCEDIAALLDGEAFAQVVMADYLPPRYLHRYTPVFAKQFLTCVIVVGWKLRAPSYTPLACVAEELALAAIIQRAKALLESEGESPDFGEFEDSVFDDTDFEQLWDPKLDGLSDSELGRDLGMASLDFKDWFKPFRPENPVHPYVDLETTEIDGFDDTSEPD
jgi:hypothetical protein